MTVKHVESCVVVRTVDNGSYVTFASDAHVDSCLVLSSGLHLDMQLGLPLGYNHG